MKIVDVDSLADLPSPPVGYRYFDFLGGEKTFRCYLVPADTPRNEFIEQNEHLLDEVLKPIYKGNGICIRQDASYAVPGFYIVYPAVQYRSFDLMSQSEYLHMFNLVHHLRTAMRRVLGLEYVHLYYEEKSKKSCNVHIWVLPIHDIAKNPRIYEFNLLAYLELFKLSQTRAQILDYNASLRDYFNSHPPAAI